MQHIEIENQLRLEQLKQKHEKDAKVHATQLQIKDNMLSVLKVA